MATPRDAIATPRWVASRAGSAGAVIVGLASGVVYLNALPNGFTYDDVPVVLRNPATEVQAPWWEAWRRPWWRMGEWAGDADRPYRPLTVQIFALERRVWGDWPLPYHALNLVLHACNSIAVYLLARRFSAGGGVAMLTGVCFAIHPIHTEAVSNIVGRAELLSVGGMLLAVLLFDRYRRAAVIRVPAAWWIGITLASAVAVFSKERGVAVVVLLVAWQVWTRRQAGSIAGLRRPVLGLLLLPMLLVGIYIWLRLEVCGSLLFLGQRYGPDNVLRDAGWLARMCTPFALLGRYLLLMVWPDPLRCNYSVDVLHPVSTLLDGPLWVGIGFVASVCWAGAISGPQRSIRVLLAICFAATYFPASNSLVLVETLFAERWFYGPAVWLCVGVVVAVEPWVQARLRAAPSSAWLLLACAVIVFCGLATRTVLRNPAWSSNEVLFVGDLRRMEPGRRSAHLCCLVGRQHFARGELDAAEGLFREAAAIFPDFPEYYQELGKVALAKGDSSAAVAWLERAFALQRRNTTTQALLAVARARDRGVDLYAHLSAARAAAERQPGEVSTVRHWARLAEQIDPAEAVRAYRRLITLVPNDPAAWNGLAYALGRSGQPDLAAERYQFVTRRWPDNWEAHGNLATLLMDAGAPGRYDPAAAIEHARRAVQLNPSHWQLRANLAEVLANCGLPLEAAALFEHLAAEVPPESAEHQLCLQRAAALRGGR